jgi:GNAT superfamily N-acetyltransferase
MKNIQIRLPTPSEQTSQPFIPHIVKLVNEAYASTESNLYKPSKLRTDDAEVQTWLASQTLHLAFKPDSIYPIGSVRVYKVDATVSDVGILTVHRDARALGLGRKLVAYAEAVAVKQGAKIARLEMLVPVLTGTNEAKSYLNRWYRNLGYEEVGRVSIAEIVPQLVESFEEESEFLVMEKGLVE